jgi:acyl-CoA thioesterase YciA
MTDTSSGNTRSTQDPATEPATAPLGELVIRTLAMPADANANGDIFGGWVMAQMDMGGAVIARRVAKRRITTVAVEAMSFLYPIYIGDLVSCYARLEKIGRSSMQINVEVWVERAMTDTPLRTTKALFTYVALDENGRPVPVNP